MLCLRDLPRWKREYIDFVYWHWGSLAAFHFDDARWKTWRVAMERALRDNQVAKGCARGSWEPVDRWSCEGGRVTATAINLLTLLTAERYARLK